MKDIKLLHYGREKVVTHWNVNDSYHFNRIYKIHGGAAYFTFQGQVYPFRKDYFYLLPQTADILLYNDKKNPIDHTFLGFFLDLPLLLEGPVILDLNDHPLIDHGMDYFTLLSHHRPYPADIAYESMVSSQFNTFLTMLEQQLNLTYSADIRLSEVLQYIHSHYSEPLTIPQLAAIAHMEPTYFIRFFRNNMNTTPHQYLKNFRLHIALTLLKSGISVTRTAQQTGYTTVSSFSNTFKKQTGFYPSDILKQNEIFSMN